MNQAETKLNFQKKVSLIEIVKGRKGDITKISARAIAIFILALIAASTLVPFLWMFSTSIMTVAEVYSFPPKFIPEKPQWGNYAEALLNSGLPFGRFFLNTVIMAAGVITGRLLIISLAAYAFARIRFPGRDQVFILFIATMMIPEAVTLIPSFLILTGLNWVDTFMALIIPGLNYVWGLFLLRQYFSTLPESLEDAARIDGASEFQIFYRIFAPLAKPALAVIIIFSFVDTWKNFLWPLIVTRSTEMRTIEVGIMLISGRYFTNIALQMAAATIVAIPIILVFLFSQRYFMEGINLTGGQKL